jgi:hypothetical protein
MLFTLLAVNCIFSRFSKAIRKHPYGDEANDWEGVCIPSPIRAQESNFACCGRSFRPEGRGLNQQGKLIKLEKIFQGS